MIKIFKGVYIGFYIDTTLGRPKGNKDSKPRPKSGYYIREANKRGGKKAITGNR
ncbi:MAG: hypothetical protein MUO82_03370 [Candidatus Thermoplasmatota archaeon]|nr:hypothetical protein [Candidatus Thermoplasmatota archaeon]